MPIFGYTLEKSKVVQTNYASNIVTWCYSILTIPIISSSRIAVKIL